MLLSILSKIIKKHEICFVRHIGYVVFSYERANRVLPSSAGNVISVMGSNSGYMVINVIQKSWEVYFFSLPLKHLSYNFPALSLDKSSFADQSCCYLCDGSKSQCGDPQSHSPSR